MIIRKRLVVFRPQLIYITLIQMLHVIMHSLSWERAIMYTNKRKRFVLFILERYVEDMAYVDVPHILSHELRALKV